MGSVVVGDEVDVEVSAGAVVVEVDESVVVVELVVVVSPEVLGTLASPPELEGSEG